MNDQQAEDFILQVINGKTPNEAELNAFDDWKFEHSTVDVVELIKKSGERFRAEIIEIIENETLEFSEHSPIALTLEWVVAEIKTRTEQNSK